MEKDRKDKSENEKKQEQALRGEQSVPGVQVLIPFDASKDDPRRLLMLLRSLEAYALFHFTPVIVGDRPEQLKETVKAIPFADHVSHDTLGAVVTGIHSDLIDDNFVAAPLNTYLNQPIMLAHLQIPKCTPDGYDSRFPMFINKEAMLNVYGKLTDNREIDEGLFTLYNRLLGIPPMLLDWKKDWILLPVVSEHPDPSKLAPYLSFKAAVFIQHDSAFDEVYNSLFALLLEDEGLGKYENHN